MLSLGLPWLFCLSIWIYDRLYAEPAFGVQGRATRQQPREGVPDKVTDSETRHPPTYRHRTLDNYSVLCDSSTQRATDHPEAIKALHQVAVGNAGVPALGTSGQAAADENIHGRMVPYNCLHRFVPLPHMRNFLSSEQ